MGLAVCGAIIGGVFGYLLGIDKQRKRQTVRPVEYAVGGLMVGAVIFPALGTLAGL